MHVLVFQLSSVLFKQSSNEQGFIVALIVLCYIVINTIYNRIYFCLMSINLIFFPVKVDK